MIILKPCPFCGSKSPVLFPANEWYYVYCSNCHSQTGGRRSKENAIDVWNSRPTVKEEKELINIDNLTLPILECVDHGAGSCRNEILIDELQKSCKAYKNKARVLADELENLRNSKVFYTQRT